MRTTIDRAGRLVIPKMLRERAGITAGEVEIQLDGAGVRIEAVASGEVVDDDGLLVVAGEGATDTDELRELRLGDQR